MLRLKELKLINFRNHPYGHYTFEPGLNVIYGENAQGKTALFEAMSLLMTGRSFRSRYLKDLIRFGENTFVVEILFEKGEIDQTLRMEFSKEGKKVSHNATYLSSLSALLGIFSGVLMTPEDQMLVKGPPKLRRDFLNLHLSQMRPLFLTHLTRYLGAMKHRNAVLKTQTEETLDVWEEQMAESAAYIAHKQLEGIEQLNQELAHMPFEEMRLEFSQVPLSKEEYMEKFLESRPRDLILGVTSFGPHKSDFTIFVASREAKQFASESQQRSAAVALKFAQFEHMQRKMGVAPLMLIDDVGVSFDKKREKHLFKKLEEIPQVFVTTPAKEHARLGHLIEIKEASRSCTLALSHMG